MDSDNPPPHHFPAGLRVLVVDDDPTHSQTLHQMLAACNYKGTICSTMQAAIDLLREGEEGFDIVITDFNLSEVEGFKLLKHLVNEMKIPVIMMSLDVDTSTVIRGVKILQHMAQKRMPEGPPEVQVSSGSCGKKRKDDREGESCSDTPSSSSSAKKLRVVWNQEGLHDKFVKAVNQIGVDKAGPKKILDLMGTQGIQQPLTRENVASHLQKYRQSMKRNQQEEKVKVESNWMKASGIPSADHASENVRLRGPIRQDSVTMQPIVVRNGMFPMPLHANASAYLPISNASRIGFIGQLDSESRNNPHFQQGHHFDSLARPSTPIQHHLNHLARPATQNAPLSRGCDGVGRGSIVSGLSMENQKSALRVWGKELNSYSTQGDIYMLNQNDQTNLGPFGCSDSYSTQGDIYMLNQNDQTNLGPFGCSDSYSTQGDIYMLNQNDQTNLGPFGCSDIGGLDDVSLLNIDCGDPGDLLECLDRDF